MEMGEDAVWLTVDSCEPAQESTTPKLCRRRSLSISRTRPDLSFPRSPSPHLYHPSLLQLYRSTSSHDHRTSTFLLSRLSTPVLPLPLSSRVCRLQQTPVSAFSNNFAKYCALHLHKTQYGNLRLGGTKAAMA